MSSEKWYFGPWNYLTLASEDTLLSAPEVGITSSTPTPFLSALLFEKASPVRLQEFTTQRDPCFKVNAVNPDVLLEKLCIYIHEKSWCWADVKHSCGHKACLLFFLFLLFLPHGNRSHSWGHLSPLAQKYNKEYKIFKDTAGNKCLLSSLPATHRNHSKTMAQKYWAAHGGARERRAHNLADPSSLIGNS